MDIRPTGTFSKEKWGLLRDNDKTRKRLTRKRRSNHK